MTLSMKEIKWNLINASLAGILVFLGTVADGNLTWRGVLLSVVAGGIVAVTKFQSYWKSTENNLKAFSFI